MPVQPAKKRWTMVSNPQTAECVRNDALLLVSDCYGCRTRARMFWAGTLSATDRPDWNGFTAWLSTAEGKAMFAVRNTARFEGGLRLSRIVQTEQQKIKEAKDAKKTARATTTA